MALSFAGRRDCLLCVAPLHIHSGRKERGPSRTHAREGDVDQFAHIIEVKNSESGHERCC
jgi:hypothetical protein